MIFMAKVCPKAINFATAESIHQPLALRPHPNHQGRSLKGSKNWVKVVGAQQLGESLRGSIIGAPIPKFPLQASSGMTSYILGLNEIMDQSLVWQPF